MVRADMENSSTVRVVVALALLDSSGKVLMQQRPQNKAHGGLWEFPGGKVESEETCESATVREIDEELGVTVDAADLFPISFTSEGLVQRHRPVLLLLFGTRRWRGTARPVEPGSAIRWAGAGELTCLPMPPLDVPLARAVIPLLEGLAKAETAS
jgi:8-oxo-dGTP diphosphatase